MVPLFQLYICNWYMTLFQPNNDGSMQLPNIQQNSTDIRWFCVSTSRIARYNLSITAACLRVVDGVLRSTGSFIRSYAPIVCDKSFRTVA